MTQIWGLITTERERAADLIEHLTPEQADTASLCGGWRVRDVAGHLVLPFNTSRWRTPFDILRAGGFDAFSQQSSIRLGARPPRENAAQLRMHAGSRFTPPGHGPEAVLTDLAVHVRDMARPLGLDVSAPAPVWRIVLDFLVTPGARRGFVPPGRISGLELVSTDLEWSAGSGAVVRGPAEALALAALGRPVALADLSGDGAEMLGLRIG